MRNTARAAGRGSRRAGAAGLVCALVLGLTWTTPPAVAESDEPAPVTDPARFFEAEVRPLLAEHCFSCHGPDKQESNLRLDSAESLLTGGASGEPIVTPGDPERSRLILAVSYEDDDLQMPPPDEGRLTRRQVNILKQWIAEGAVWPEHGDDAPVPQREPGERFTDKDRAWWAIQPLADPDPPAVDDGGWARNDIDRFIFAKLDEAGLEPAPEADRTDLIRRLYFDLIGLPPSPEEGDAFLADESADAYEKVVDRLLGSDQYGERWARHWLDLVRYAESDGWRADDYRPHIWRYRDYVIDSFNDDKPYDRFVREQLSGDEIAPDDPEALVATGFLRHGLYEWNQRDAWTQRDEILDEITDVVGDVFLGVGMACARCHDHKFDPVTQADYYELRAFFEPLLWRDDVPMATPDQVAEHESRRAEWEELTADLREKIEQIEQPHREAQVATVFDKFHEDLQAIYHKPAEERDSYEEQLAYLVHRQVLHEQGQFHGRIKDQERERWDELREELEAFDQHKPDDLPPLMTASDADAPVTPTVIPGTEREVVPALLGVMGYGPAEFEPPDAAPRSTGRRAELARLLTEPDNPLTTRVIANRIWQYHTAEGIVATPSDFGHLGEMPAHPELLDYLARRFVADGWSFKRMHRLIVTSAAYRQSAKRPTPDVAERVDPGNRLLWRMRGGRLDAEQVRDAMLAASGELDLTRGGPSVEPSHPRRSIYTRILRNSPDPLLSAFDAPAGFTSTAERNVTTTPTQSLLMINSEWVLARAEAMAGRLLREPFASDDQRVVAEAYRLAFGAAPESAVVAEAADFLRHQADMIASEQASLGPVAEAMPKMHGQPGNALAALLKSDSGQQRLEAPDADTLPTGDFTIEAIVVLHSLYDDATVRTIVSQWNDDQNQPGWSLGITSEQSAHDPRNVILQLVGDTADGERAYEVIASDLRPELDTPYYVAVSVSIDDTGEAGVAFYMKDLSDPDAKIEAAFVEHDVIGNYRRQGTPVVIGGRAGTGRHAWDGLIERVRISDAALGHRDLLLYDPEPGERTAAYWRFDDPAPPGFYTDASGRGHHIRAPELRPDEARRAALTDLCHVLMNSSAFLYVD